MPTLGVTIGGYAAAFVLGWLWLDTRDELASTIERCNTDKIASVLEAEQITRKAIESVYSEEIERAERRVKAERNAYLAVAEALREAESRPVRVRTVIRESEESCLTQEVPKEVLGAVRE